MGFVHGVPSIHRFQDEDVIMLCYTLKELEDLTDYKTWLVLYELTQIR